MQTSLSESLRSTPAGKEADRILRSCVHCGFCTATCPTYRLLGDELDGPRGRIYLIKNLLEEASVSERTQLHLDRCLTCRACETTCPSGVEYGRLLDIGRTAMEQRVERSWFVRAVRATLRWWLPYPQRLAWIVRSARLVRALLPKRWAALLPDPPAVRGTSDNTLSRRVLLLEGCVQAAIAPRINAAASVVLARLGIATVPVPGCCGALSQHLTAVDEARAFMRANIDRWWPEIERGAEAIVSTASGCGSMVKEYGYLLRDDPNYAERAARVSALAKDVIEICDGAADVEALSAPNVPAPVRVAFQAPCTLQHGQRLGGRTEALLQRLGFHLTDVAEAHLCCGSAGTYSILQPTLARRLGVDKVRTLLAGEPQFIATANIGCLLHLQGLTDLPVRHWLELLADDI